MPDFKPRLSFSSRAFLGVHDTLTAAAAAAAAAFSTCLKIVQQQQQDAYAKWSPKEQEGMKKEV